MSGCFIHPQQQEGVIGTQARLRLRTVHRLIIASVLLAVLSLLTAFPLMSFGACLSWPLALAAVIVSFSALVSAWRGRGDSSQNPGVGRAVMALVISVLLLPTCTFLNVLSLGIAREVSKNTISAANLTGLGHEVAEYADKHGTHPPSLESLIKDLRIPPRSFVSPFDPVTPDLLNDDTLIYTSYIYTPGVGKPAPDPDIVIAYEREPFTICEPRILAPKERWVLFGDGQVRHLTDAEFADAMRKDEERRRELGWSPATLPATSSPGGPSARNWWSESAPWSCSALRPDGSFRRFEIASPRV